MLTKLSFQNFKSWKDTRDINLAPITGLFGTNSSGKTAILQMLLMLKQTVESSDQKRILHFGDEHTYVDLGTSYDVLHQHIIPGELSFSITWECPLFNINRKSNFSHLVNLEVIINLDSKHMKVSKFTYSTASTPRLGQPNYFKLERVESKSTENSYRMTVDKKFSELLEKELIREDDLRKDQKKKFPRRSSRLTEPIKFYGFPIQGRHGPFSFVSSEYVQQFENLFEHIYYLGPLRDYPRRLYAWSGEKPQDVGRRGELAIAALLASRHSDNRRNEEEEQKTTEENVAFWLKELGLIHSFRLDTIAKNRREYEICICRNANSAEVPITDVGFGVSQILPVLTLCYYVPRGSTIILEQPEIHLHPSVQAGLADVFIDVMKNRNVQILLESHSEHLLRRLQRRIAEEKHQMKNSDVALYFCEMTEAGTSQLNPLELDEYGNINNWPEGFFGDEMGDLFAMTEAAMIRQQKEN